MKSASAEWRRLISSLSDQQFLDLARNYLTDVRVTCSRQRLTDRLESFLREPETAERIISYIDEKDRALLTAAGMLGKVSAGHLYPLFAHQYSYLDFYRHLLNLEERMLICSDSGKITVSPLFRDLLEKRVSDTDSFIGSVPCEPIKREHFPWYGTSSLAAFMSYLLQGGNMFRNSSVFRKKYSEELAKLLAPVLGTADADLCTETLRRFFTENNLIRIEGKKVLPETENLKKLASFSPEEVRNLVLDTLAGRGTAVRILLENMRLDRLYSETALERLFLCSNAVAEEDAGLSYPETRNLLASAGLIASYGNCWYRPVDPVPDENLRLVVQPNATVYVTGDISLKDNLFLALCGVIREVDMVSCYELNRGSCFRGMSAGIGAVDFISFLEEKSGSPVPQNIAFTVRSWETEFNSISVDCGFVVKLDDRFRSVMENNREFVSRVKEKLADGIYFVDPVHMDWIRDCMESISDREITVPQVIGREPDNMAEPRFAAASDTEILSFGYGPERSLEEGSPAAGTVSCTELFGKKIAALDLNPERREMLMEKAGRRLILFPDILLAGSIKYEKTEAGGIDYTGKKFLCDQVIKGRDCCLEILPGGEQGPFMLRPTGMKKLEKDYLLTGITVPGGEPKELLVGKIRMVRKLRLSFDN